MTGIEQTSARSNTRPDLSNCEREPIHVPGSIQPHGALLVLAEADLSVVQASENVGELLGVPVQEALGRPLGTLLGADTARRLGAELPQAPTHTRPAFLRTVTVQTNGTERTFHAVAHRTDGGIVLELELATTADRDRDATPDTHPLLDAFTLKAEAAKSVEDLSRLTCEEVRRLTGFDRVLIYRFDEGWNGTVIGEDGSGRLPSYLHHRFPASDIPAQARELYRLNRLRIIPDGAYRPVPVTPAVNPVAGKPLDMSFSALRSVSPVHVEYMRNMETAASMSVSILRDGRLWGLVSCHHKEPKTVSFPVRGTCDLIARAFSLRLSALEYTQDYERRIEVRSAYSKLLAVMADRGDFAQALAEHPEDLTAFADAQGAALLTEGGCLLFGKTPAEPEVRDLADWLFRVVKAEVYSTDSLSGVYPTAAAYKGTASGLLAVAVSKLYPSYVLWFRPEVIQTIQWGGDPAKPVETNGDRVKLHPRRSFATWRETVRDKSLPWRPSEVEGAGELRNTIVGTVLRKAEELADLNAELVRSNKELEAFSYSVSHDLRAPLRHIVGYAEMMKDGGGGSLNARGERCLATIIESSEYAGRLVDKLLGYSRLGRAELQRSRIDLNALVAETKKDVMRDAEGRHITWNVGEFPTVVADLMMLRMAVRDLLTNAVKYTREKDPAVIEVGSRDEGGEHLFWVKDNGVGFDMDYADKLFGVFQRLHRWEEYEGTGIGLANVRRVIDRHGGRTWAEGKENEGATFYFTLPKPPD
jgi:light-regulated signal transduction histidine kinase (bacteriophytochrome)